MSINTASGFDLSNFPLAPNPSGAPPDFKHGASLRPLVLGFDTTMIVISAIFVGIRAWVNCRQLSKVMLDDGMFSTRAYIAIADRHECSAFSGGCYSADMPLSA
jgi:hypothetical protein